jgi:hypothetical protein
MEQMAMIEKNVASCYVWNWEKSCMPINGEKYTTEGYIPAYFHWWSDKTDFTNQNIKFLHPMMIRVLKTAAVAFFETGKTGPVNR